MTSCVAFGVLFAVLLIITAIPDAASYSKYGRSCKDIGCRSDETCVMAEDPCTGYSDKCGRYPTCRRTSDTSCTTIVCGDNEYCKSENGVPRCVRKSTQFGYESAGVSYVNGERVSGNDANNPYANANAPPIPANPVGDGGYHRSSYGNSQQGYPPYPSNGGYPSYPQSTNQATHQQNSGYPPYPTQNKMPMPGQPGYSGYPQASGGYPQQYPGNPGYHANYPNQNYPNQNYPNQNRGYGYNSNSIYRRNGAATTGSIASATLVGLTGLLLSFTRTMWFG